MRIGLGQFNATVGGLASNVHAMRQMWADADLCDVELLIFPELSICGYPPEDLLYKKTFLDDNRRSLEQLAAACPRGTIIAGFAECPRVGRLGYNAAAVIQAGRVNAVYRKAMLPNYSVFDERRYFQPGTQPLVVELPGCNIAVTICEDMWDVDWLGAFLEPARRGGFDLLVNISASPFHLGKAKLRDQVVAGCATRFGCAVAYCNLVGGQDELVFDGRSMFADSAGNIVARARAFEPDLLIADVVPRPASRVVHVIPCPPTDTHGAIRDTHDAGGDTLDEIDEIYQALVLGTRDYARKNGFEKVLLGLSGGIDSSVTAAIAAAALGADNVVGVTMPTRFNSPDTIADAQRLARNLRIEFHTIPIEPILQRFDGALSAVPGWTNNGLAYENLQARIRGCILMSLSNQFGALVLTTGNKSETAVGYATLYGDTAGGFAVIKDVPKTVVYQLAEYINKLAAKPVIPADVIARPPSAELRPDQKDTDSLPEYDLLDKILAGYVEADKSAAQLIDEGLPEDVVRRVIRMTDRNEYKRRLSPPGVKITPKAFGKDRRLPITNHYKEDQRSKIKDQK